MVTLVTLLAVWSGALDVLHIDTHVQRMLLAAGAPNSGEPVLVIGIDAASERELKRSFTSIDNAAAWRRDHARLVDRAARAGARAVVFDIFFERATDADAELADAARRASAATRVVFGARRLDGEAPDLRPPLRESGRWGSLCLIDRGSGALWSTPLAVVPRAAVRSGESVSAVHPALALAALVGEPLRAADVSQRELRFDGPLRATPVRFTRVEPLRVDARCRIARAGDEQLALLLRVAPAGHWRDAARQVSYAAALDAARVADQRFKDRIVLVGAMDLQQPHDDVHVVRNGFVPRQVFGVELQADAIATLNSGRVAQLPTVDLQLVMTLIASVVGAAAAVVLYRRPRWWRRAILLALALTWALVAWWFATRDIILNPAHDVIAMLLSYLALRAMQWLARTFHRCGGRRHE